MEGSADENKAVVQGTIAHFGTYTVNERLKDRAQGATYARRSKYQLAKTGAAWRIARVVYGH